MILHLWMGTLRKAQVSRRFSLTYPQAVSVVYVAQGDPIVAAPGGKAIATMGSRQGWPMLRVSRPLPVRMRHSHTTRSTCRGAGAACQ